ncbi:MAG: glycosyltransferase [Gemmataceae bacterium]|nr:glycosyltransferase [Gemmataceae bacterium]
MTILNNGFYGSQVAPELRARRHRRVPAPRDGRVEAIAHGPTLDPELLRRCAWEIGETRAADAYTPTENHLGLGMVSPCEGFAHWRILQDWADRTAAQRGPAWRDCRLVLRLYDVSYLEFNGLNAHRIQDHTLPALAGHLFYRLPRAGTWQLGEVGFLLRSGEFVPAARSRATAFARDTASGHGSQAGLLVGPRGTVEEVGNIWDQDRILRERRRPKLRRRLRIAAFAFESLPSGQDGALARLVSELAAGQSAEGHDVHVFVPASGPLTADRLDHGAHYHPLPVPVDGTPLERSWAFGEAAEECLLDFPPFDLVHLHEWMAGLVPRRGTRATVLSLTSVEATRRNGAAPTDLSREVAKAEREAAHAVSCVLVPHWLRDTATAELHLDGARVRSFPLEGRMPNEWECPLDYGHVKQEIGVGPLDRLILFVGPLEEAAGVDLLVEAMPTLLARYPNLRLAFVGGGNLYGRLHQRAHQLGVAWAVRVLGHVEGPQVTRLVRSAEALALPSRWRVPHDDAVVDLARRAGRPVVTTHGGPAHLVRHEENGLLTYDNPGSMVWAMDRILGDPAHAERLGRNGQRASGGDRGAVWSEVVRHYLEVCAASFPELVETTL